MAQRLKRPKRAARRVTGLRLGRLPVIARVRGPQAHPKLEIGDYAVRQLLLGRHDQPIVTQGLDEQALHRLAGHDRGCGVAALEEARPAIEPKPALGFLDLGRVTPVTVLNQDRPDLLLKERRTGRIGRMGKNRNEQQNSQRAAWG